MIRVEVLVVGGGPAGLAVGIALAEVGVRVRVAESRPLPADKACGEGLMPSGLAHLEALGVRAYLDPAGVHPFAGVRYRTARGREAAARFAEGAGLGIRRLALSAALLDRARAVPGLTVRDRAPVRGLVPYGDGWRAEVAGEPVAARFVIGADGLHSRVRRAAGLEGRHRGARFGLRRHYRLTPWDDHVEVHQSPGAEAYVTPVGPDRVGVALLWDRRAAPADFDALLARFPALAARLARARPDGAVRGAGPFDVRPRARVGRAVALVGDAAGYVDAITGEGVSLALAEARALARVLPRALSGIGPPGADALADYERAAGRLYRSHARVTRPVVWLSRHPLGAEAAVRALGRAPGAFRRLLSWNMGPVPEGQPAPGWI